MKDNYSNAIESNHIFLSKGFKGVSWKVLAFACYAMLNALARFLSGGATTELNQSLPVPIIIFFQDLFALMFLAPWIIRHVSVVKYKKPRFGSLHLLRVILSAIGVTSWYFALWFLPQVEAVALSVVGPMFGVLGAKWLLGEKISVQRGAIICVTFLLAVFCMNPVEVFWANKSNGWGLLCVLISAMGFALAKLATRRLAANGESPQQLTAYLLFLIVPVSLVPALFVWVFPTWTNIYWLILAGFLTALAIYAVSMALSYSEVSFLAPFDFIRIIFNFSIGYLVFMELPHLWTFWVVLAAIMFSLATLPFKWFKRA